MNFNITEKLEKIRQKPEHIRMRYVWFWLAVSMFFIFVIWIFSVKENFKSVNFNSNQSPNLNNGMRSVPADSSENSGPESINNLQNK